MRAAEPLALRLATARDAEAVADIYAPYVLRSTATFEYEPPNGAEMARRMCEGAGFYPWLCAEARGAVCGYAYAGAMGARPGFAWAATAAIYIRKDARGGGAGQRLYAALFELLAAQGVRALYALVTRPNRGSEAFHLRMGFDEQGFLPAAGYKFGRPLGLVYYGKALLPAMEDPPAPIAFRRLDAGLVADVLDRAARDGDGP